MTEQLSFTAALDREWAADLEALSEGETATP